MIEFKSGKGSQVVRVEKTSAGITISTKEKATIYLTHKEGE